MSASKNQDGGHSGDPHCFGLTQADVACQPGKTPSKRSIGSTRSSVSSASRTDLSSCITIVCFNGMAVET